LRGLSTKELVSVAARFRFGDDPRDVPTATKFALRSVARRYEALSAEISELEVHLEVGWWRKWPRGSSLYRASARERRDAPDRGREQARRLGSEASFASLCAVSPIEASSGKVVRHRLNLE
jgi:transposase